MDANDSEKPKKLTTRAGKTELKHQAMLLLSESGMSSAAIAQVVERHPQTVKTTVPRLRRESLSGRKKVKLASKLVENVMEGFLGVPTAVKVRKVVEGIEVEVEEVQPVADPRVKASDALRAAELVYSRYEPLKPEPGAGDGGSKTFLQVNQAFFAIQQPAAGPIPAPDTRVQPNPDAHIADIKLIEGQVVAPAVGVQPDKNRT